MKDFTITCNGNLINYKWKMPVMPNYFFITSSLLWTYQLHIKYIVSVSFATCKTVNVKNIYTVFYEWNLFNMTKIY